MWARAGARPPRARRAWPQPDPVGRTARKNPHRLPETTRRAAPRAGGPSASVEAARGLNRASGMLAASVLFDSGLEHYRADFFNKAMYTPLVSSSLSLAASLHGTADARQGSHPLRHATLATAALVGIAGGGFHIYNVARQEGGFVFQNLFYSAPLGAPYALILSGILGAAAEWVRDCDPDDPRLFGVPADRILAGNHQRRASRHRRRGRAAALPRRLPEPRHGDPGRAAARGGGTARQGRIRAAPAGRLLSSHASLAGCDRADGHRGCRLPRLRSRPDDGRAGATGART